MSGLIGLQRTTTKSDHIRRQQFVGMIDKGSVTQTVAVFVLYCCVVIIGQGRKKTYNG